MSEEREDYTIQQALRLLGISRTQLYRMIGRGELRQVRHPLFKPGSPVRIARPEVDALVRRITEDRPDYRA